MEKSDFDRLLKRYLNGETTEQETKKVEAWLDVVRVQNPDNEDLSRMDEDRLYRQITASIDNTDEIRSFRLQKAAKLTTGQWIIRSAAAILIISLLSYAIGHVVRRTTDREVALGSNEIDKIILTDGTLVWLKGDSKLAYYEKPDDGTRYGELTGEALFEVAKDPDHPFVVRCGNMNIKVVGTSFSVKTNDDQLELNVLTGKVNLSSDDNPEGVMVEPNEKVTVSTSGEINKQSLGKEEIETLTKNTEYNMTFANTTMKEVLERMEDKFNVNFTLENRKLKSCTITADFTDHSLESSLQMITEVLDVGYTINGKTIIMTGSGCP